MLRYVFNPFTGIFDAVETQDFDASCPVGAQVGHFVHVVGDNVVEVVDVDDLNTMPAVGLIVEKPTPTSCVVQTGGEVELAGLLVGVTYIVGTDSKLAAPPIVRPGAGKRAVQTVGTALSATQLWLRPSTNMTAVIPL